MIFVFKIFTYSKSYGILNTHFYGELILMAEKSVSNARLVLRLLTSGYTVISGIFLTHACITMYLADAYSRESAASALSSCLIVLIPAVLFAVAGLIFEFITDSKIDDTPNRKDIKSILTRFASKKDITECDPELTSLIKKERKRRKIRTVSLSVLTAVSSAVFLAYSLNGNNFSADINTSVIGAMKLLIPCLIITFAFAVYTVYRNEKSIFNEIELLKKAPNGEMTENAEKCDGFYCREIVKVVLLIVGTGLFIYGYLSGGIEDVLTKAVNICTECIGLG